MLNHKFSEMHQFIGNHKLPKLVLKVTNFSFGKKLKRVVSAVTKKRFGHPDKIFCHLIISLGKFK